MTQQTRAVFLSYASQDAEAARRICDALRAAGIEVWFDQSELRGGDAWDRQIRKQIHDCALFIPIISATTQGRLEGYFRREWRLAVDRTHDMADGKPFLVPVVIDDTNDQDAEVPDAFRVVQWSRLTAGTASPAFVERVSGLLSPGQAPWASARPPVGAAPLPLQPAPVAPLRWKQRAMQLIATAAVIGAGYIVVEKFVLSKRPAVDAQVAVSTGQVGAPARATIPEKSIAVLPFVDLSEKHDQEYFGDGIAEEILNLLVKIPELKVIGRTSSFQFKGKTDDLRRIGVALGAAYVLEGSVRRSGDHIRITAQLIDARDGSHRWSETFDRNATDILRLQEEIATNIAHSLNLTVSGDGMLRAFVTSPQAYDYYLRGLRELEAGSKESNERGLADYQTALALDPKFAPAAAGVAEAFSTICLEGFEQVRIACERAREAIGAVLKIDPNNADAYAMRAELRTVYDWDWDGAKADVKKSEGFGGGDYTLFAAAKIAYTLGDMSQATRLLQSIIARNPLDPNAQNDMAYFVDLRSGRYSEAEAFARRALDITPQSAGLHLSLGLALLMQGKLDGALASMKAESLEGGQLLGLAVVYSAMGRKAESDAALKTATEQERETIPSDVARIHAFRGELEQAMDWFDKAYASHDVFLFFVKDDPLLKKLGNFPRYKTFLRKMNLPE